MPGRRWGSPAARDALEAAAMVPLVVVLLAASWGLWKLLRRKP